MTDITFVMQAVIAFASAVITILFIPWLWAKHDEDEVKIFLRWVEIAVAAAEQIYGASDGLKKKAYVIKWLEKKGYTANVEEINAAIEAAVLRLHKELYGRTIPQNGDYRITQPYEVHTALLNMGGNDDGQQP